MSKHYGVECDTCEEFIKLGDQDQSEQMVTYLPSKEAGDAVQCPHCGSSHVYGSSDIIDEDSTLLNPWAE
jgi:hypothetical protein